MNNNAEAFFTIIFGLFVILFAIFLIPILSTLVGMIVGWVVGLFFSNIFADVLITFGLQPIEVWKLGAFVGFVSGFFRGGINTKKD